jgi:hypothetical protein
VIDLILSIIPGEWLAGLLALAAAFLGVWVTGRRSGAEKAEKRGLQDEVRAHEIRNEVDNRVASERDARERLRNDWGR